MMNYAMNMVRWFDPTEEKKGRRRKKKKSTRKKTEDPKLTRYTPVDTLPEEGEMPFSCKDPSYKFRKKIGQGSYGDVYTACRYGSCRFVAKSVILDDHWDEVSFSLEARISKEAGVAGYGPVVRTYFTCRRGRYVYGVIIMERLGRPMRVNDPYSPKALYELVDRMHEDGVWHGDLYPRNIMWDFERKKLLIIDYGSAFKWMGKKASPMKAASDWAGLLYGHHMKRGAKELYYGLDNDELTALAKKKYSWYWTKAIQAKVDSGYTARAGFSNPTGYIRASLLYRDLPDWPTQVIDLRSIWWSMADKK